MRRFATTAFTAAYCFAMIGLIGGIGVMASGAGVPTPKPEGSVGMAIILLLQH
ncbi:MAG: hypothetical protein ACXIVE_01215 [Salinarimonas sp.]